MISKRSKVYVTYLYIQIKYKSITGYIKNKKSISFCIKNQKGGGAYIIVANRALHFKYIFKE